MKNKDIHCLGLDPEARALAGACYYSAPGGWLVDRLFVQRDVRRIFEYRTQKLRKLFG